jgi:hypothetical protein
MLSPLVRVGGGGFFPAQPAPLPRMSVGQALSLPWVCSCSGHVWASPGTPGGQPGADSEL